jgi:hypothetical protein
MSARAANAETANAANIDFMGRLRAKGVARP